MLRSFPAYFLFTSLSSHFTWTQLLITYPSFPCPLYIFEWCFAFIPFIYWHRLLFLELVFRILPANVLSELFFPLISLRTALFFPTTYSLFPSASCCLLLWAYFTFTDIASLLLKIAHPTCTFLSRLPTHKSAGYTFSYFLPISAPACQYFGSSAILVGRTRWLPLLPGPAACLFLPAYCCIAYGYCQYWLDSLLGSTYLALCF